MSRWAAAVLLDAPGGLTPSLAALLMRTLTDLRAGLAAPIYLLAATPAPELAALAQTHSATVAPDPVPGCGTGGAIRALLEGIAVDHLLVVNGDSYSGASAAAVTRDHEATAADCTVVVSNIADVSRSGYIALGPDGEVLSFEPPRESLPMRGWAHAGITAFRVEALMLSPPGVSTSIDRDLLPSLPLLGWRVRIFPLEHGFEDASGARFE